MGALYEAMALCYHRLAEAQQPLFASQPAMAAATEAKCVPVSTRGWGGLGLVRLVDRAVGCWIR